jgi:hypothetical protein
MMMHLIAKKSARKGTQTGAVNTGVVVGIILAIILVVLFFTFYKRVEGEVLGRYKGEAATNEFYAFERWLGKLNAPLTRVKGGRAFDDLKLQPTDTLILLDRRFNEMTPSRIDRLWKWVESGGHLIVLPELGKENDHLLSEYEITTTRYGGFFGRINRRMSDIFGMRSRLSVELPHVKGALAPKLDYGALERDPASTGPALIVNARGSSTSSYILMMVYRRDKGSFTVLPSIDFVKDIKLGYSDNAEYAWGILTMPRQLVEVSAEAAKEESKRYSAEGPANEDTKGEGSGESELNYEPGEVPPAQSPAPAATSASPEAKAEEAAKAATDEAAKVAAGEAAEAAADAVAAAVKAAQSSVDESMSAATASLARNANATRGRTGNIYMVELLGSASLFSWLVDSAPIVLALICAFIALWLLRVIPRFGPLVAVSSTTRASLRDHFTAAGHFLMREGAANHLLRATRLETIKLFELRLPGWHQVPKLERAAWLAEHFARSNLSAEQIERAFNAIPEDKLTFVRFMQVLAVFRQALTPQRKAKDNAQPAPSADASVNNKSA